ncbi:N-acetylmuramoyl-L-alanine amidase [Alkaliphilus hydrothermalis]|uniref:N-acetylmuramoyl-L-alanine amidase n=1 Tax=Alkaliphilus hydrothermalis TaxID=1482730 RepID=A0ABS2NLR3_9FIRM|nr:N-acetylmuramoyl-L-alanine amidase [Alkaliphilus hydrothermalis]MBM7613524.1 N-acetylmuramoyl-L-alanine amidase [Alkaliphilus hydrothermalis]
MKVVIDPGHGGQDRSNHGPTGYVEADGVLDIGLRLRKLLEEAGYTIKMTRDSNETIGLYRRSEIANDWGGNLYLSLHTNAASTPNAKGIEIFHSKNGLYGDQYHDEAKRVAEIILELLIEATGLKNRGTKTRLMEKTTSSIYGRDYYAVIRRTRMPSLIIELGFHTNPKEEALLKTAEFRQKLAESIAAGVKKAYPVETPQEHSGGDTGEPEGKIFNEHQLKVMIEGQEKLIDGYIEEGIFYVPIRFLEQYGYKVRYDARQPAVVIDKA